MEDDIRQEIALLRQRLTTRAIRRSAQSWYYYLMACIIGVGWSTWVFPTRASKFTSSAPALCPMRSKGACPLWHRNSSLPFKGLSFPLCRSCVVRIVFQGFDRRIFWPQRTTHQILRAHWGTAAVWASFFRVTQEVGNFRSLVRIDTIHESWPKCSTSSGHMQVSLIFHILTTSFTWPRISYISGHPAAFLRAFGRLDTSEYDWSIKTRFICGNLPVWCCAWRTGCSELLPRLATTIQSSH